MTATPEAQKGPSAAAAEKPPVVEMVDLYLTAEAVRIAVPIVAEAGIADLLLEGPLSVSALAAATGLDADALGRLLRLLASLGIFAENGDGEYVNTRLSETLAAGVPMSMRDIAAIALTPGWSKALAALPAAVRQGGATAWDLAHGTPIFEYFPAHPDEAMVFQSAMTMFSEAEAAAVTDAYDFSGIGTLRTSVAARACCSRPSCARPRRCAGCCSTCRSWSRARPSCSQRRLGCRSSDGRGRRLLRVNPRRGRAHPQAHPPRLGRRALRRDFAQLPQRDRRGGRLLVVEEALPPGNAPSPGKILDLFMLMVGGRERTQSEYGALFEQAGYELKRIIPTATPLHVIEATMRQPTNAAAKPPAEPGLNVPLTRIAAVTSRP